jgi:hypothetical protein
MDDFNKPITPIKRSELSTMKIEPIIDNTHEREESPQHLSQSNKTSLILSSLYLISHLFKNLPTTNLDTSSLQKIVDFRHNLHLFNNLLIKIRDENPTEDLQFADALSKVWHTLKLSLTEEGNNLQLNFFKINSLFSSIEHYPEDSEHSFGFYLSHYSGKEWFPMPFFQLLNKLHTEHLSKNNTSDLDKWIKLIHEILFTSQ